MQREARVCEIRALVDLREAAGPVISCSSSVLREVDVLGVVQVSVGRVQDGVDDARLQVQENGSGDVVLVVSLQGETKRRDTHRKPNFCKNSSARCGPCGVIMSTWQAGTVVCERFGVFFF